MHEDTVTEILVLNSW